MSTGEAKTLETVKAWLNDSGLEFVETEEDYCTKLTVKSGQIKNHISVYNTGRVVIGGPKGPLKTQLDDLKSSLEEGQVPNITRALPSDFSRWPTVISERIPNVDGVIVVFVEEALKAYSADALLSCAFMLGAASERAFGLLIGEYASAISDSAKKEGFKSRINGRAISRQYDEFMRSFKSCKTQPTDDDVGRDLELTIGLMFQFCRMTRNDVGHPHQVPHLDRGALLANLGHFVTYLERIYKLMAFFASHPVEV